MSTSWSTRAARWLTADPLDPDDDCVTTLLDQNLMTSLRLSQMFARRMIAQTERAGPGHGPAGSIVNLSSIAARRTLPDLLAYSVSCAAIDQMTRSMAVALAPHRIRVNAVALGSVMSASLQGALKDHAEYRGDIIDHTPLARIASAGRTGRGGAVPRLGRLGLHDRPGPHRGRRPVAGRFGARRGALVPAQAGQAISDCRALA